jgi:hypothetical protein
MAMPEMPYDVTNTNVPADCININKDQSIFIDGHQLTAEYIWSKNGQDRIDLVYKVLAYYRTKGFPVPQLTDIELVTGLMSLKKNKLEIIGGEIKNSATAGLDIAKHFTGALYLAAKGGPKTLSCLEVFNDDELFLKVLKNRMGWVLSNEDVDNQPYLFNITDKMIFQGMRSSGLAYNVSNFKPAVAKALYEKYKVKKTLDSSAGWGARAVAAVSCGVEYYGIDPLTADSINNLLGYFRGKGVVVNSGSEDLSSYAEIPKVDFAFTSPPYFLQEIYSSESNQSTVKFKDYSDWLNLFWKKTVENTLTVLEDNGNFAFAMIDLQGKNAIGADTLKVCQDCGLELIETINMVTAKSHLTGKAKSGNIQKNSDRIYVMKKPNSSNT